MAEPRWTDIYPPVSVGGHRTPFSDRDEPIRTRECSRELGGNAFSWAVRWENARDMNRADELAWVVNASGVNDDDAALVPPKRLTTDPPKPVETPEPLARS